MSNNDLSIRLSAQGGDDVLRALEAIGAAAQRSFNQVNSASRGSTRSANDNAKAVKLSADEWKNLGFQANDALTMLASGSGVMQVLATQTGQVYQTLAGSQGGLVGGLKGVASGALSIITPARVAGVTLAGAAALAYSAWSRYDDMQKKVLGTLQGVGRYTGLTTEQFERLAERAAAAGNITVRQATDLANALARTGNLGPSNIEKITALLKDFSATFTNGDLEAGAKLMAQTFGNGAAGLTDMVQQLRLFQGQQVNVFNNLLKQNKLQEATSLVLDSMKGKLASYKDTTGQAVGLWERFKNTVSDIDLALGRMLDKASRFGGKLPNFNVGTFAGAFGGAEPDLAPSAQSTPRRTSGAEVSTRPRVITANTEAEVQAAERALGMMERTDEALGDIRQKAKEAYDLITKQTQDLTPFTTAWDENIAKAAALRDAIESNSPALKELIGNNKLLNMSAKEALDIMEQRITSERNADGTRKTDAQHAKEDLDAELAGSRALTQEERKRAAIRQAEVGQFRQNIGSEQARIMREGAGLKVVEADNEFIRQGIRDQGRQAEMLKLERDMLFATDEARQIAIAGKRAEQELTSKGIPLTGELAQKYLEEARANAERAAANKKAQEAIGFASDSSKEFAKTLLGGLREGKKFAEALADSLDRLASKLLDKSIDLGIDLLFKGVGGSGSGGGLLKSLFGFADGGIMTSAGPLPLRAYSNGGVANSPQLALYGEGRLPEAYVPLPDGRTIPVTMQGGGGGSRGPTIHQTITQHISANGDKAVAQIALQAAQSVTQQGLAAYDKRLPGRLNDIRKRA